MNKQALKQLEADLWRSADTLRANSDLKSSEYSTPVLGLIFLKFADNKYRRHEKAILAEYARLQGTRREKPLSEIAIEKCGFYLPDHARYDYLLKLPEEKDIAKAVKEAMKAIEEYKPELQGVLPQDEYFRLTRTDKSIPKQLLKNFADIPQDAGGDMFGQIYEYFLGNFAMAEGQGGGEFFTPRSVVRLMVEIIEPHRGKVYDPACGSGGMFVQFAHFIEEHRSELAYADDGDIYVCGQEKTLETVKLAKMNLAVNGLRGDIKQANTYSYGAAIQNINTGILGNTEFRVPPLNEQKKIAAILSAYDDLIENNRCRIALLEKMAEEIYREWFVRMRFPGHEQARLEKGVPEGWQRAKVESLVRPKPGVPVHYQDARHAPPPPNLRQTPRRKPRHPLPHQYGGTPPMKFETFQAGVWRQRYQYKSFEPVPVNHDWSWEDATINTLLEAANRALGELNAFSLIVPDIDLFIEMHVVKEAQTSSRIEGTQTGIDEALMSEEQIQPEKRNDWREVRNYIDAVNTAVAELKHLPLSNRLLKQTHEILMRGVRGEHKQPGEFRTSQNWIGGSSLADAVFIPAHPEGVADLMGDLEAFWHNEDIVVPHLIRLAISHYQFETVHPFLDGNGRIGRLLIPLYLVSHGLLAKPSLYLSDFFERNRASYYDALMRVRVSNDLVHWVRFFLQGMAETATKGREVFQQVLVLRTEVEQAVLGLGKRAATARQVLNLLYRKPVVTAADIEQALSITTPTANALIRDFQRLGVLQEITGQQRGRAYAFDRYLRLFLS